MKLMREGKLGKAEQIVRDVLKKYPADVTAIRMLADIGYKIGHLKDASLLLERCLELAPDFRSSWAFPVRTWAACILQMNT